MVGSERNASVYGQLSFNDLKVLSHQGHGAVCVAVFERLKDVGVFVV
jgi:hypothetical protein